MSVGYLWQAALGGVGVALLAGPLGAVMVWRRLAYFGDTLSHSGLLGVTLALAFHLNITVGITLVALMVALLMLALQKRLPVTSDTLLGLLSHTTLALGLLALAAFKQIRVDVLGFLYGDILAITHQDLMMIYGVALLILLVLYFVWSDLLRMTIDKELAKAEGVSVVRTEAIYVLLLAVVIAFAIKMVGVLLITALLIVPAATARLLSSTPEQMAGLASGLGMGAVLAGLFISHLVDLPAGPAIVVSAAFFLLLILILKRTERKG